MMLFTALLFGSSFPFAKPIMTAMDPMFYSASRYLLGALVVFAALKLRGLPLGLGKVDRKLLLLCCVSFALFQGDWAFALSRSNASVGAIFMATSPIFGALLASLGGQRLRPAAWAGIALAFCGVLLVINNSLSNITITLGSLAINALWLANAMMWAFYSARSWPLITAMGPARMFAWVMLISALLMLPLGVWGGLQMDWPNFPQHLWLNYLYTALVTSTFAATLWNIGMRRLGITRTMIYMYLVPIFAVAIAVIFLGEAMTLARSLGAIAVLAGIYITRRAAS
jgi:O-acetylserine/cysteine efflux transporter